MRVNVGCGQSPTPGWENFDNSWTVRLSSIPFAVQVLRALGCMNNSQVRFATAARQRGIRWADAVKGLPVSDNTADVVYSSHMLEHLDRDTEVPAFLDEARRILVAGGVIRLVVPDLRRRARRYIQAGDADEFIESTRLACSRHSSLVQRMKFLALGHRHHLWMYDGPSLCQLLEAHGFQNVRTVPPGESRIQKPGPLNLTERADESVYVEAENPN